MSDLSRIRDCLDHTVDSSPAPWVYAYGAEVEQIDSRSFHSDGKIMDQTIRSVTDLFDLPFVVAPFDTTIEAEALGSDVTWIDGIPTVTNGCVSDEDDVFDLPLHDLPERGRIPAAIDGVERLVSNLRSQSVVMAVTGPSELVEALAADDLTEQAHSEAYLTVGDALTEVIRSYVDAGTDAIAIVEPDGVQGDTNRYARAIEPVMNLLDHYNRDVIFVTDQLDSELIEFVADVGFDGATGTPTNDLDSSHDIALGYGVPGSALQKGEDSLEEHLERGEEYTFVTTSLQVPTDASIDRVHRLMGTD